jgi:hypothetical protein
MIARRIINALKGVNRVVYDVTSNLPGAERVGVMISTCYLLLWLVSTVVEWVTCFRTF